jgi:hypothetical protein
MKGHYSKYILFEGKNIKIQWVLTFRKILLPLVLKDSQASGILRTFLDYEKKKHTCFVGCLPIDALEEHLTR